MRKAPLLFLNVFIIATCGLIYELIAGALASFVLGDSITQFSTCIGVYLFALGIGAWLSGFLDRSLERCFIETELGVALLGGFSAPLLFLSFSHLTVFRPILYGLVFGIGTLVGLELPLLMRILRDNMDFKVLVARVLTFDYIGALVASLAFPLLLVPRLGLIRTSLLFGLLNAVVALWGTWILKDAIKSAAPFLRIRACIVMLMLAVGLIKADQFTTISEEGLYDDVVVYSKTSSYQRIIVTSNGESFNLYLNGNLQFSSTDEYRYHEALVHPAMSLAEAPKKVLVVGGGDGLGVREVLREEAVESVTLVDLDPEMTGLATVFPPLAQLNENSLSDSKVQIVNDDAMVWLEEDRGPFDVVLIDFPDPNNFSLGKLYTRRFFRMLERNMADDGVVAIQCTSSMFTKQSYWCILKTMEQAGLHVAPYHASVPTFGVWGFAAAMKRPFSPPSRCQDGLRFLNSKTMAAMFVLPNDLAEVPVEINRLDNQVLVRYYEHETSLVQ